MKSATAATCLPVKHYFAKEFDLTKKNTRKPPHQVGCQSSYTKISEPKDVLEKETDATQKTNKKPSHSLTAHAPLT